MVGARHAVPAPRRRGTALTLLCATLITWRIVTIDGVASSSATPEADSMPTCDVVPRSREDIATLLATSSIATPAATTAGQVLPEGTPVSATTAAAIERTVQSWLACQNAGEPLRGWALFSDGYLYRLLSRQGMPELVATPPAARSEDARGGARLVEIRGARRLLDGRHGAIVTVTYPSVPMPKTFFFYFTEGDDRLLIDGILGEISFSVP